VADSPSTEALRPVFERARATWPGIDVALAEFAARPGDGGVALARLDPERQAICARDLYLACACSASDPRALAEFDRLYLATVRAAVARIDQAPDFIDEVQQVLRERLLVGDNAKINSYRGTGPLAAWVRTAAVRTALNLKRAGTPVADELATPPEWEPLLDAETAMLQQRHRSEINEALTRALAELDSQDRLLLRFYYVENLTLAKIAVLNQVGISTVFRRLTAVTSSVLTRVKVQLAERLGLSTQSLDSLIGGIKSQIDLSLSQLL
jgi:RNA polymerase sigma-70 factor (ECF subfamily)